MSILERIASYKREELAAAQKDRPLNLLIADATKAPAPRGFRAALERAKSERRPGLIAEIKQASPSKGVIRRGFAPETLARDYERGGATCLSVLTDGPSFQGAPDDLVAARRATKLPILRKDFMLEPYQVLQSRAMGADCILVILAMLTGEAAGTLIAAAGDWGMDCLVEVHDEEEIARAAELDADLIGINNRDLKTFVTDIDTAIRLKPLAPPHSHVVAESGLSSREDLTKLAAAGISSFLIGETFMRAVDVEAATRALISDFPL